jgi:menaquinone-dependent protoporphyrinogen oxidase
VNVLVTAAGKHGSTEAIGREIELGLRARAVYAEFYPPDEVKSLDEYDAVIIGSAVYGGHWIQPATTFVDTHSAALRKLPVWLFSSGPIGDPPKPAPESIDVERILHATGAREHRVFSGRIEHAELSFVERAMVKAVHADDGDYRDWTAVRDFAFEIADELTGRSANGHAGSGSVA